MDGRRVVLKVLGVRNVADWCDCSEAAVYQWLSRAKAGESLIPAEHIPAVVRGAAQRGISFEAALIWPDFEGLILTAGAVQ